MKIRCIRPFKYAADHINNVRIAVGDVVTVPDQIANSLLRDGFAEGYWPEDGETRPMVKALGPAPENRMEEQAPENKRGPGRPRK